MSFRSVVLGSWMYDGRVDRRPGRTSACREARCSARGVSRSRSRRPPGPPGGAPSSWRHPPDGGPPTRCAVRRRAVERLSDERRHRVGVRPGPVGRPPVRTVGVAWPDGLFLWRRLPFLERELSSRGLFLVRAPFGESSFGYGPLGEGSLGSGRVPRLLSPVRVRHTRSGAASHFDLSGGALRGSSLFRPRQGRPLWLPR